MYLALWLISRWRLPTTPCLSLPVAVSLKRFLTPLLVLSLGIFVSLLRRGKSLGTRRYPTATACLPAGPLVFPTIWKGGAYRGGSRFWQAALGGGGNAQTARRARTEQLDRAGGSVKPAAPLRRCQQSYAAAGVGVDVGPR